MVMIDIFKFFSVGKQYSDAVIIESEFFDSSDQAFQKMKSYNDEYSLLMQNNSQKELG